MDPVLFAILTNCVLVVGLMSIFFACFTMLLVLLWPKRYFLPEIILQFLLAVVLNMTNGFVRLLQSDHETSCVVTALIDHYSMLVVFFWVAIPSYELTIVLKESRRSMEGQMTPIKRRYLDFNSKNRQIAYSLVAWGIPLFVVSLTLIVHVFYPQWEPRVYGGIYCSVEQQFIFLFSYVLPQFVLMFIGLSCFAFLVQQYSRGPFSEHLKESIYFVLIVMVWTETLWCLNLVYNLLLSDSLYITYWFSISFLPGFVGLFVTYRCWHLQPQTTIANNHRPEGPTYSPASPEQILLPRTLPNNTPITFGKQTLNTPNRSLNSPCYPTTFRPLKNPNLNPFLMKTSPATLIPSGKLRNLNVQSNQVELPPKWTTQTLLRNKSMRHNVNNQSYVMGHPTSSSLPRRFSCWEYRATLNSEAIGNLEQQRRFFQSDYFVTNSEHSDASTCNNGHTALVNSLRDNNSEPRESLLCSKTPTHKQTFL